MPLNKPLIFPMPPESGDPFSQAWVVLVLFNPLPDDLWLFLTCLQAANLNLAIVDNNPLSIQPWSGLRSGLWLHNANHDGLAGGFNAGIQAALAAGARWITLLDQDSRLTPELLQLLQVAWQRIPRQALLVGPAIVDASNGLRHGRYCRLTSDYDTTRLLISSGTTFKASDWPLLGPLPSELFIDFVDHAWCFRAAHRGFRLIQDRRVILRQTFGAFHPNPICRFLGLRLYSPVRHYYSIRNLRWLLLQRYVPFDLKIKELLKMLVKPFLWLAFEPSRASNLRAILRGLLASLPALDL